MSEQPLPDEVTRLFGAMANWTRDHLPPPASGMAGSTCEWCPICQFVAVLRGDHPELTGPVVEAGAALLGALRSILEPETPPRPRPRPRPHLEDE